MDIVRSMHPAWLYYDNEDTQSNTSIGKAEFGGLCVLYPTLEIVIVGLGSQSIDILSQH